MNDPEYYDAVSEEFGEEYYYQNDDRVSHEIRTSGGTFYQNKEGRCEDAPCCGCCTC